MPKIYQKPESKHEGGQSPTGTTGMSRETMIAIAVVIALIVIFLLYRIARGEIMLPG